MNDETTLSEAEVEDGREMAMDEPEQPEEDEEAAGGPENVVRFPGNATEHAQLMRMVEALLFAAAEPLDIDSIAGRLPEGARRLVLDVRFTIDRAGRVMRVDLVSSSGNAALDQAAKDVIWRASPMPQMAQDMISETLELTFPVIVAR